MGRKLVGSRAPGKCFTDHMDTAETKRQLYPPGRFLMFMKVPPCEHPTELEGLLPKRSKKSRQDVP